MIAGDRERSRILREHEIGWMSSLYICALLIIKRMNHYCHDIHTYIWVTTAADNSKDVCKFKSWQHAWMRAPELTFVDLCDSCNFAVFVITFLSGTAHHSCSSFTVPAMEGKFPTVAPNPAHHEPHNSSQAEGKQFIGTLQGHFRPQTKVWEEKPDFLWSSLAKNRKKELWPFMNLETWQSSTKELLLLAPSLHPSGARAGPGAELC